jgi:hypothetical protein
VISILSESLSTLAQEDPWLVRPLAAHLRAVILFEPSGAVLGLPPTDDFTRVTSGIGSRDGLAIAQSLKGWVEPEPLPSSGSNAQERNTLIEHTETASGI